VRERERTNKQTTATARIKADPYGMTNKKGSGKSNCNGKSNRRSFDSVTRECASYFAQDDSFIRVGEQQQQPQRQKQIPFGDDKVEKRV
jgi:hypothetical protein